MKKFLKNNIYYLLTSLPIILVHLPFYLVIVLVFFVYTPFYYLCSRIKNIRQGIYIGCFLGILITVIDLLWVSWYQPQPIFIFCLVVLYEILVWTCHTILTYKTITSRFPWLAIFSFTFIEWLQRENPIFASAYMQTPDIASRNLYLIQTSQIFGYTVFSILICASSYFIYRNIEQYQQTKQIQKKPIFIYCSIILVFHVYGVYIYHTTYTTKTANIAVIQEQMTTENFEKLWKQIEKKQPKYVFLAENALYGCRNKQHEWLMDAESVYQKKYECKLTPTQIQKHLQKLNFPITIISGLYLYIYEESTYPENWDTYPINQLPYQTAICLITKTKMEIVDKLIPAPQGEKPLSSILPFLKYTKLYANEKVKFRTCNPKPTLQILSDFIIAVCICYEHMFPDIWEKKNLNNMTNIAFQSAYATTDPVGRSPIEHYQSGNRRIFLAARHHCPYLYVNCCHSEYISANGTLQYSSTSEPILFWNINF